MTAAVAGRVAARGAGTRAATSSRRPLRAGGRSASQFLDDEIADVQRGRRVRPTPKPKPPSQKGYADAIAAGDRKPAADGGGGRKGPASRDSGRPATPSVSLNVPGPVSSGAGVILALLFWSWVGLPLLTGGPAAVKAQLMAKFVNKAPDGSWLP